MPAFDLGFDPVGLPQSELTASTLKTMGPRLRQSKAFYSPRRNTKSGYMFFLVTRLHHLFAKPILKEHRTDSQHTQSTIGFQDSYLIYCMPEMPSDIRGL